MSLLPANLAYLVPFPSLLFIASIVGERIEASTIVGLILIVTGVIGGRSGAGAGI